MNSNVKQAIFHVINAMDIQQHKKAYYKVEATKDATVGRTITPGIPPGSDGEDICNI